MTRKNNFKHIAENKSRNSQIGVNKNGNNVRFYRKNLPQRNNAYATYINNGNDLIAHIMFTNVPYQNRKYQQNFLRLAINAAKLAGYKSMSGTSVWIDNYKEGSMPPSSYIFKKFGFIRLPGNNVMGPKQRIKWALKL